MLVDTHCHLNFKSFNDDFLEVAKRSRDKGVEKIIIVGSDPVTSERAIKIATEMNYVIASDSGLGESSGNLTRNVIYANAGVYACAAVGIHAIHTDRLNFEKIEELAEDSLVVAIGESGMDFYHDSERQSEKQQEQLFKNHIELAIKLDKPLIIHNRQADEEVRRIVDGYPHLKKAVLHCFSTDHHMARWALERGFYLSFTGNITYGNKKIKKAIERTPIERIMVETDAPYNVPEPLRSGGVQKCEPWMCSEVINKIATIKNLELSEASKQIYENSIRFFDL